jgi:hypothetical protein
MLRRVPPRSPEGEDGRSRFDSKNVFDLVAVDTLRWRRSGDLDMLDELKTRLEVIRHRLEEMRGYL